ncbi:MAG: zinc metalloprotease HtpX [Nitrososphaerota archaeon]|nr:zinc metalloprotease HtpX [Candidatus Aenigmarchaeota archaeon]
MSLLKTAFLLGLLTALFMGIGFILGGMVGLSLAFFLAFILNFITYFWSDKIVLSIYGAKEYKDKKLENIVKKLANEAKIPIPKLYIVNLPVPNAFATGRNPKNSALAVTRGLINILNEEEIEGVLSHEIAHIKNRDTLIATISATIAGAISYLAQFAWYSTFGDRNRNNILLLPLIIFIPFAAMLIQLAISRTREYAADYTGALISKKPNALASALEKIFEISKKHPINGNYATSHLWIVNPFSSNFIINLFSTHPPIEERIKRLREIKV